MKWNPTTTYAKWFGFGAQRIEVGERTWGLALPRNRLLSSTSTPCPSPTCEYSPRLHLHDWGLGGGLGEEQKQWMAKATCTHHHGNTDTTYGSEWRNMCIIGQWPHHPQTSCLICASYCRPHKIWQMPCVPWINKIWHNLELKYGKTDIWLKLLEKAA